MSRLARNPRFWFAFSAVIALALDQVSKALVRSSLTPHLLHPVLGQVLRFYLTMNERGLFGMSYGPLWMHRVLPLFVVGLVIYFGLRKSPGVWFSVALGLILGGGIGNNLIDRFRFGSVVDFIDLGAGTWRWYTFNLADAFALAGVIMILAHEYLGWGRSRPAPTAGSTPAIPAGQA